MRIVTKQKTINRSLKRKEKKKPHGKPTTEKVKSGILTGKAGEFQQE